MTGPTWYDVLGVEPSASTDDVRAAWRTTIADLDPSDRRFRSANEAAEVLLDPQRRAAYDASLTDARTDARTDDGPAPAPTARDADPVVAPARRPRRQREPRPAREPRPRRSGPRVPLWVLGVVGVLAVALVALAVVVLARPHVDADEVSRAQSAAEQAIVPVLSYDYRELDEDAAAARGYLTEGYQEDYDQLFTVIADNAERVEAVVRAEVIASSVVRTSPDRVEVLLFVNRPTTNRQYTEPRVFRDQVTVTMQRVGDDWLVDQLETTPAPQ